ERREARKKPPRSEARESSTVRQRLLARQGGDSVGLRCVQLRRTGFAEQLFENLVVHGQQLAVALIEALALAGQLAELLPGMLEVAALGRGKTSEQLVHGLVAAAETEGGQHLAAALRPGLGLIHKWQDLLVEQVDLPAVSLEQLLIQLLHQPAQPQIVGAVLMQVLLDHLKQLLLTRSGHASLPLW